MPDINHQAMSKADEAEATINQVVTDLQEELGKPYDYTSGKAEPVGPNVYTDPARAFLTRQCAALDRHIEDARRVQAAYKAAIEYMSDH